MGQGGNGNRSSGTGAPEWVTRMQGRWPMLSASGWVWRSFQDTYDTLQAQPAHLDECFLCWRALAGDRVALQLLEKEYLEPLRAVVSRLERDADFADECVQLLRQRLLVGPEARLRQYTGQGPLRAWLTVAIRRLALDQLRTRRRRREQPDDELCEVSMDLSDTNSAFALHFARVFDRTLERAFGVLQASERNILRLYFVEGASAEAIGRVYQRERSSVYRWLRAWREKLYAEFRATLDGELGSVSESEVHSLLGLVEDRLEVSLSRLLGGPPAAPLGNAAQRGD